MKKLTLSHQDIVKAIRQYYIDYEYELAKIFDFENLEIVIHAEEDYIEVEVEEK